MKVFRKIGNFFKSIWRYIKQNAWIQPILMVGLIFAIIFGLTKAESVWNTIKGWFTTDSSEPQHVTILGGDDAKEGESDAGSEKLIKMFEEDKTFVVIFAGQDCSMCANFNKNVLNVFLDDKAGKSYRDDIYYFYSNEYIEYINDVYDDGNKDQAQELVARYEKLMEDYYVPAFNEFKEYFPSIAEKDDYTTTTTVGDNGEIQFKSAETPTILYVVDGEVMGFLYGDISNVSNSIVRFQETLEAWKLAQEDFEAGKAEFKDVLELID